MHTGDEAHFSPDEIGGTRARMTFGDVESKVDLGFIDRMNENASFCFFPCQNTCDVVWMLCLTPLIGGGWRSRGGPAILFTHFRPVTEDHERGREIYSAIVSAFGSRENDRAPSFPLSATISARGCAPPSFPLTQPRPGLSRRPSPPPTRPRTRFAIVTCVMEPRIRRAGGKEDFEVVNETRAAE